MVGVLRRALLPSQRPFRSRTCHTYTYPRYRLGSPSVLSDTPLSPGQRPHPSRRSRLPPSARDLPPRVSVPLTLGPPEPGPKPLEGEDWVWTEVPRGGRRCKKDMVRRKETSNRSFHLFDTKMSLSSDNSQLDTGASLLSFRTGGLWTLSLTRNFIGNDHSSPPLLQEPPQATPPVQEHSSPL